VEKYVDEVKQIQAKMERIKKKLNKKYNNKNHVHYINKCRYYREK